MYDFSLVQPSGLNKESIRLHSATLFEGGKNSYHSHPTHPEKILHILQILSHGISC